MTDTEITLTLVDPYRITASVDGRHLATALHDSYGWGIHARRRNGAFATVARVSGDLDPAAARDFALIKLHQAAATRLVGAA